MYCQDVGTYIWKCTNPDCGILACVAKAPGDHGCIDATPDELTDVVDVDASMFRCPQCYRATEKPLLVCPQFILHPFIILTVGDTSTRFVGIQ
ncbi:hypothetical protein BDR03DRAFT_975540 [Suillus americanus]|nr:hypothetical protein BDR03DRAFT_975540 [Suillus americanus]